MMPAPRGIRAHIELADSDTVDPDARFHEVVAFDNDGNAMILDDVAGRLFPASEFQGFKGLIHTGEPNCVGFISSAGWHLTAHEDGQDRVSAIVGWAITDIGDALPIRISQLGGMDMAYVADTDQPPYAHTRYVPPTAAQLRGARPNGRVPAVTASNLEAPPLKIVQ